MSFQAYLDSVKAKTGKTPEDFRLLAVEKGLAKHAEIIAWLKADFGLGHGHANAIAMIIKENGAPKPNLDDKLAAHFSGAKAAWRKPYDALAAKLQQFGSDVSVAPTSTYISLLRGQKKFGIAQISAADRMDIGIKLKGVAPTERLEAAGTWNAMVTHRVRISDPKQIDKELLAWLKQAYDPAK